MTYRKKLIEVALPLKAINEESARRKRKAPAGYPTTIHKWWAQRPLAACRAVLFASLVDDPDSDPMFAGDEDLAASKRAELFNLIEELVQWENSSNSRVINRARAEIARCVATQKIEEGVIKKDGVLSLPCPFGRGAGGEGCQKPESGKRNAERVKVSVFEIRQLLAQPERVNAFLAEYAPPVLDPFCGGGSIPLEAQRLGLRAHASDLNPVAVLITKALVEIPPKFAGLPPVNPEWQKKSKEEKAARVWQGAQGLAEDVRYYGKWMRHEAEKRIGHLYPKVKITKEMAKDRPDLGEYVGQELTVIAWLWARTVQCPNPGCGARAPLVRSFWLSKKKAKQCYAKPVVDRDANTVRFEIATKGEPPKHTTDRNGARCLFCETFVKKPQLREISVAHRVAETPLAIVVEGNNGRLYLRGDALRPPCVLKPGVPFLEQPITNDKRWFSPPLYGMPNFADLFTPRQLVALTTFSDLVQEVRVKVLADAQRAGLPADERPPDDGGAGPQAYAEASATFLACAFARAVDYNSAFASWRPKDSAMRSTLGKQAIPMVWDFAEANPLEKSSAGFADCVGVIAKCVEMLPANAPARVEQLDATASVHRVSHPFVCTDPPYYDNIGYADLSDYFYIWLRRAIAREYPTLFSTLLTPKVQELIASPHRHGDKEKAKGFFENGLRRAFRQIHESSKGEFPIPVFYAFKQSESEDDGDDDRDDETSHVITASTGWETMLEGLIKASFSITGTWPMRTEGDNRQVGLGANALASSIVLVCRPRPTDASLATRKQFMSALRHELPQALKNLQHGNIAPVDLAQAAIGPGMAVLTRYAKVIESDGSPMTVRTALGIINHVLDEVLAEQEGEFDAETRWSVAWFEQSGMEQGPFGVAETLSKAKNTAINGLVEAGVVVAKAGKVRLVRRDELPEDWDPATDGRLTVWEITQHLIRKLEQEGESAAAALIHRLGGVAETARDLAYRLYNICDRKKWADEARPYNSLVLAWPELTKLALAQRTKAKEAQQEMF